MLFGLCLIFGAFRCCFPVGLVVAVVGLVVIVIVFVICLRFNCCGGSLRFDCGVLMRFLVLAIVFCVVCRCSVWFGLRGVSVAGALIWFGGIACCGCFGCL